MSSGKRGRARARGGGNPKAADPRRAAGQARRAVGLPSVELSELQGIEVFTGLSDDQLAWLAQHARRVDLAPGEALFHEGEPANVMFAVIAGEFRARREKGHDDGRLFVRRTGQVGGMLPYSRITHFPVTGRAVTATTLACFAKEDFAEMLTRVPELEARLVATLSDRVREAVRSDYQREKLLALGKLSAGLAHELNNPAAAVVRAVAELRRCCQALGAAGVALGRLGEFDGRIDVLDVIRTAAQGASHTPMDAITRSALEEELAEQLKDYGLADPWFLAEQLMACGLRKNDIDSILAAFPAPAAAEVLAWLHTELSCMALLNDIDQSARRISDLVAAVKSYSQMDQAPALEDVDVLKGLDSTLQVLGHKLSAKAMEVTRSYAPELPRIRAYEGDLNQVWTHLIDNAVDAVDVAGHLTIEVFADDVQVVVRIVDDGPGIPDELHSRVFEPFFTTKEVGQGTGMGLDIVRRIVHQHRGDIRLESEPRRTCFEVRLPADLQVDGQRPNPN